MTSVTNAFRGRPEWLPLAIILGVLALYVACDVSYARAWHDRLSYAFYVADHAPQKPRALTELALSLMEQRRFREAAFALDVEETMIDDPMIPKLDREDARESVRLNRQLLARMTGH